MDVSQVLTQEQRAAGLRLVEPDDHLVVLVREGQLLGVFSQQVERSVVLAEAEFWREQVQNQARQDLRHGPDAAWEELKHSRRKSITAERSKQDSKEEKQ